MMFSSPGTTGSELWLVFSTCSSVHGGLSASQAHGLVLGSELGSYCSLSVRFRGQRPALRSEIGL